MKKQFFLCTLLLCAGFLFASCGSKGSQLYNDIYAKVVADQKAFLLDDLDKHIKIDKYSLEIDQSSLGSLYYTYTDPEGDPSHEATLFFDTKTKDGIYVLSGAMFEDTDAKHEVYCDNIPTQGPEDLAIHVIGEDPQSVENVDEQTKFMFP